MANNKPTATLRDGKLKATIWKNVSEKGAFYSVNFSRGYTDDQGVWHDTDSFNSRELLAVGRLAAKAYDRVNELRQADKTTGEAA